MFDVGFAELFLLALIGLLVLGPERLPGVARTLGGFVRKARASWNSLRHTIESELAEADLSAPIKQAQEDFKQIGKDLADIPSFNPEKADSTKKKPQMAASEDHNQETTKGSVKDTDSEKDENV